MLLIRSLLALLIATAVSSVSMAAVTLVGDPKVAFIYFSPKNDGLLTAASILPEDTASKLLNTGTRVPGSKSFNSNVVLVKKFIFFTNFCTDIPLGKALLGNKLAVRHCDLCTGVLIFSIPS